MVGDPSDLQNSRFFSLIDRNLAAETRSIRTAPTARILHHPSQPLVRDYRTGENPARWRGHLDKLFPTRSKVRKVEHHAGDQRSCTVEAPPSVS